MVLPSLKADGFDLEIEIVAWPKRLDWHESASVVIPGKQFDSGESPFRELSRCLRRLKTPFQLGVETWESSVLLPFLDARGAPSSGFPFIRQVISRVNRSDSHSDVIRG